MPRNVRNTVLLAKIETTSGTDASPTGTANAMLISKPRLTPLQANNIDRDLVRPYLGGSEQLVGTRYMQCEFTVELVGSGTAGTAPPIGPLLRACALAETIIAGTRVDYTPISTGFESVTIYWYDDGVLHKGLGCRGNIRFSAMAGQRPEAMVTLQGLFATPSAATPGSTSFASFITPLAVTDANTGDLTLGGTVAATGAPAIAGGTPYPSMGLELDMGNSVQFTPLLGGETVDITQRALQGRTQLDLTAAQEVTLYGVVLNATLQAMSLQHGTAAGAKWILHQPSVQLFEPTKEELNGRRLVGFQTRGVPTPGGSGNDEMRLVFF